MNAQMFDILLDRPVMAVAVVGDNQAKSSETFEAPTFDDQQAELLAQLENEKQMFNSAYQNLKNLIQHYNSFCQTKYSQHSSEIATLSVKIAEKILAKEIQNENYDIQKIISNALQDTSDSQSVTVYLNPTDLQNLKNKMQNTHIEEFETLNFCAESNIGPAQCRIEMPGGTISSMVDEQLHNIEEALLKAS